MSNSTPRAALPPLPEGVAWMLSPNVVTTKRSNSTGKFPLYTAEQVEQIRRETVQACAAIAETFWNPGPIPDAILALLEEPQA